MAPDGEQLIRRFLSQNMHKGGMCIHLRLSGQSLPETKTGANTGQYLQATERRSLCPATLEVTDSGKTDAG